jgi:hypothetical protein
MAAYEAFSLRGVLRCDGVVTQFDESTQTDQNGPPTVTYAPVFNFVFDGQTYTIHSKTGSNPPEFSLGQKVPVVFHAGDPRDAQIDTFGQKWGLAVSFAIGGPFVALVGFATWYFRHRSQSAQLA